MEVQDSGMKRVLCLKDGDSERGSGIQRRDKDWIGRGTSEEGDCRGTTWQKRRL